MNRPSRRATGVARTEVGARPLRDGKFPVTTPRTRGLLTVLVTLAMTASMTFLSGTVQVVQAKEKDLPAAAKKATETPAPPLAPTVDPVATEPAPAPAPEPAPEPAPAPEVTAPEASGTTEPAPAAAPDTSVPAEEPAAVAPAPAASDVVVEPAAAPTATSEALPDATGPPAAPEPIVEAATTIVEPAQILPAAEVGILAVVGSGIPGDAEFLTDDQGADDEPGQKDLNYMATDYTPSAGNLAVWWGWDDVSFGALGGNTGDGCALFDTNTDGLADWSLCVTVDGDPLAVQNIRLYQCTAKSLKADYCAKPVLKTTSSTASVNIVNDTDPLIDPFQNVASHVPTTCVGTSCTVNDAEAAVTVNDTMSGTPKLLNVCSYPSQIPNSDPSDCVVTPNNPRLTLVKTVTNDNGGTAVPSNWTLTADGTTDYSVAGSSSGSTITVLPGAYTLSESGPAGYTQTSLTCSKGLSGTTLTLVAGDVVTCTFVNNDNAPSLTLVKTVINDNGGTALPSAWTLTAAGYDPASPDAGTYALSESGPSGYTQTSLTCSNASGQATSVTLGLGESVTCTFVNDDNAASLTLVKTLIKDNGGSAVESDWTLTAAGPTGFSGAGPSVSNGASFDAGTYALSESGPTGYTQTSLTCSNATGQVTSVTVGLGESVTCTFVNDDNAPSLTLVKTVINDNGGTAVAADWTLTATGYDALSPDAGTYALSESGPSGYTQTSLTCSNASGQVTSVTLGLGESVTCTFVNDDNAPSLTLVKTLTNDNGGTRAVTEWTLTATGPTTISGAGGASSDASFDAGTYTLSESGPTDYTAGAWSCVGGTWDAATPGTIAVALGQSATCTINNDDNAPSLTLVKTVINDNGGVAVESDWTLTAAGPTGFSGAGPSVSNGASFDAGTYALSESGPTGYTQTSLTCSNATGQVTSVTVGLGESVTCTFVNDDNKASPAGTTVMSWVLHDSITVSGLRTGADPAGSVTFRLYSDAECSIQVGSDETVGGVNANATYGTSIGVTVTDPGTYYWQVAYSGDHYNNGFTTRCGYEVTTIGETVTAPALVAV